MGEIMIVDKKINLKLVGLDSNAFSLMGAFSSQARREKWSAEEINSVINAAMEGDYNHLLRTLSAHCEDPHGADEDEED